MSETKHPGPFQKRSYHLGRQGLLQPQPRIIVSPRVDVSPGAQTQYRLGDVDITAGARYVTIHRGELPALIEALQNVQRDLEEEDDNG